MPEVLWVHLLLHALPLPLLHPLLMELQKSERLCGGSAPPLPAGICAARVADSTAGAATAAVLCREALSRCCCLARQDEGPTRGAEQQPAAPWLRVEREWLSAGCCPHRNLGRNLAPQTCDSSAQAEWVCLTSKEMTGQALPAGMTAAFVY